MEQLNNIIIQIGSKEYEFSGGGGGIVPGVPIPADTVDTDAIIDGAVEMQDLNDDVKQKMTNTYDSGSRRLTLGNVVHTNPTSDTGYQEDNFKDD